LSRKPTHVSEVKTGPLSRLLGFRVISRGDDHSVMRFPFWATESTLDKAIENIQKDAEVSGRHITAKRGHRLVRFEEAR
jgi:hypothetical protein